MQKQEGRLIFSPSDLIAFFECDFVSWMDRLHLECPGKVTPDPLDSMVETIFAQGEEHEDEYLASLKNSGSVVTDLSGGELSPDRTFEAMLRGDAVIYQGFLEHEDLVGYPDFLVRVEGVSRLGNWHYEVHDTKLSREPKPYFLVQLCCYADMLEAVQGRRPEHVAVVLGTASKEIRRFRTDDFYFYYRQLKSRFLASQASWEEKSPPPIRGKEDFGRWGTYAEDLLERQDHLCRVANITRLQIARLQKDGISTMTALAEVACDRVSQMLPQTFERLRAQARLQLVSAGKDTPLYELIPPDPHEPRRGLALLPPRQAADVFFDLEGYPLVEGGLEYLFGACYQENGALAYRDWWAHDREQEQAAFANFVRWVHAKWRAAYGMHIYHYAAYEETAIRRLLRRYPGICEQEVDDLLRNEVFVDLYTVVRQSLIVGEPSYSLKNIEHLYRVESRGGSVATADESIVAYDRWLQDKDGEDVSTSQKLQAIRDYNRDDCLSTVQLADWLQKLQAEQKRPYIAPSDASEEKVRATTEPEQVAEELLRTLPSGTERQADPERWRIQELLANLLLFHRREDKPMWWAMFARHEMTDEQLCEDLDCLSGLERTAAPAAAVDRSFLYEYQFDPDQDTKLDSGSNCIVAQDLKCKTTIEQFDRENGVLTIRLGRKRPAPPSRISLIPYEYVPAEVITQSILRTVRDCQKHGRLPEPVRTFLERQQPRIRDHQGGPIVPAGADLVTGTIGAVSKMDNTVLVVQGPPGTGKTYTAARAIIALIGTGNRVGVAANSHKAIDNLLKEVSDVASKAGLRLCGVHVWRDVDPNQRLGPGLNYVESPKDIPAVLPGLNIIAGTAWCFSAPEMENQLSHLFVDEAGQVSIAGLVGMARSTRNVVLFGDQMQLNHPVQGVHPGEAGQSCLEYLLQGRDTVPDESGVFLAITRRMHPRICSFVSGICYEDRLHAFPETEFRVLVPHNAQTVQIPAGLLFVPVPHEGNSQGSDEEVDRVSQLVDELLAGINYHDGTQTRRLTEKDLLVVAPYNMQVRKLKQRLPALQVGTVDKFQGQEAPVVIYSMCASASEDCPKGMEFLFSRNRTNVALSRAKSLAIVVASPGLARAACASVNRMRLANIFCRIMAESCAVAAAG
jgi:predicted RecB family nuclease